MNFGNQYRPNSFSHLPVVTKNIIIINILLFFAKIVLEQQDINLDDHLGLHHHLAPNFKPHQFITYIFMHDTSNLAHILFNMFGVYIFGQVLEQVWGPKRYLIFYLVTGLGAALVQYLILHNEVSQNLAAFNYYISREGLSVDEKIFITNKKYDYIENLSRFTIIGASGSLMGLLGGFGMLFPNRYLYLYFLFPVKAKWLVIFYGAAEIIAGFRNVPGDTVAHFAHIGGLLVGVLLVLLWRRDRRNFY